MPIILAYGRSNLSEKKFWKRVITDLKQEDNDFEKAFSILNKYNCIQDTITRAEHFSNVAIDSLDVFDQNEYKETLIKLAIGSIQRVR